MKDSLKQKLNDNKFVALCIIVLIILACYFFIIVPHQKAVQAKKLQACLKSAGTDYINAWASACTTYDQELQARSTNAYNYLTSTGLFSYQEAESLSSALGPQTSDANSTNCSLPSQTASSIESDWHDEQNSCFEQYPVK